MEARRAYCEVACGTCPLQRLEAANQAQREYIARNIANVLAHFGRREITEADRQQKYVHDGSSVRILRWQAQLLEDEDTEPLELTDEQLVDTAILHIANGECDNYYAERR